MDHLLYPIFGEKPPRDHYTNTWLLIFCDLDPLKPDDGWRDRWLHGFLNHFLKPSFRHVFAMRRAHGFGGWLVINPNAANIDVLELQGDNYVNAVIEDSKKGLCHIVTIQGHRPSTWRPRGLFSCVAVITHLVGATGFFLTPWQLYQKLTKDSLSPCLGAPPLRVPQAGFKQTGGVPGRE